MRGVARAGGAWGFGLEQIMHPSVVGGAFGGASRYEGGANPWAPLRAAG